MSEKITVEDIRQALERVYIAPEWYLGFEVGNSTGASCRRHADAVAINAYPSKGCEIRGFEIKVSKQDLKSELENGIKSDEIARFCDYWFLVVPKGLTDGFTLPPTWGVIEYNGTLRQKKAAQYLQKIAPTTGFLCAMLRGRERPLVAVCSKVTKDREEEIRRNAIGNIKNAEIELKQLQDKLAEVKAATGVSLDKWTPTQKTISRLKDADSLDIVSRNVKYIEQNAKELADYAQKILTAVADINTKEPEVTTCLNE